MKVLTSLDKILDGTDPALNFQCFKLIDESPRRIIITADSTDSLNVTERKTTYIHRIGEPELIIVTKYVTVYFILLFDCLIR